jgi:hypothetical protein
MPCIAIIDAALNAVMLQYPNTHVQKLTGYTRECGEDGRGYLVVIAAPDRSVLNGSNSRVRERREHRMEKSISRPGATDWRMVSRTCPACG